MKVINKMIKVPQYFSKFCALLILENDWSFFVHLIQITFSFLIYFRSIDAAESGRLGKFLNDLQIIYKLHSQSS